MKAKSDDLPNFDEVAKLLNARQMGNATVTSGGVTVTVNPQLQLESVELHGPGVSPDRREELQREIVDAVTRAMREIVIASALSLEGLAASPEIQAMRESLQQKLGRRGSSGAAA